MERRDFLMMLAMVSSVGLARGNRTAEINAGFHPDRPSLIEHDFEGKVAVIGAGVSGLFAGYELHRQGVDFVILEAADRIGGRLGKLEGFADFTIDRGGQWMHGRDSIIGELVRARNTAISRDYFRDHHYWFKGDIRRRLPGGEDPYEILEDLSDAFTTRDASVQSFFDGLGLDEDWQHLLNIAVAAYGTDPDKLSLYNEANNAYGEADDYAGDRDYKFRDSYFDLINTEIASGILDRIQLNSPVTAIDHSQDTIVVSDAQGNTTSADKVIITVPIPVLKDDDIRFSPDLSAERRAALQKFGVDAGMAKGVRYESGAQIDMDKIICDELEEDIHVWIILKEDMALLEAESKEKQDEFE